MKKTVLFIAALAMLASAAVAQPTYRLVYVPGQGEHQIGFSLAPSFVFGTQNLGVPVRDINATERQTQ